LRIEEENREEYNQNSAKNGKQLQMKKWKKRRNAATLSVAWLSFGNHYDCSQLVRKGWFCGSMKLLEILPLFTLVICDCRGRQAITG
jgi:hypothetical protein